MNKPRLCCDSCFNMIAEKSIEAAKLWLDMCDLQASSKAAAFGIRDPDIFPWIRQLELMGFVLTTDQKELTLVKVLGEKHDNLGLYFCGGMCEY